jgi:hypothetical protein
MIPIVVGAILAAFVAVLAAFSGMDRDRAFYPTVLIVVASYYALFAVIGSSNKVLMEEIAVGALFLIAAVYGFKKNAWLVAAALAGHGVFDFFHSSLITNHGMPIWWPGFCGTVDVALGAWMALQLFRSRETLSAAT